ncbi:MAG: HNH endonuclease [Nocardia sp.]|nr:HNH endonuclease [Nocardia sp.]
MRWGRWGIRRVVRGFGVPAAAVVVAVVAGCGVFTGPQPAPGSPTRAQLEQLLGTIAVVPKRPHPGGYDRDCGSGHGCVFGPAWSDDHDGPGGHDGCDSRNQVLAGQLREVRFRPGSGDCVVASGTLRDPYTGHSIGFVRAKARVVQIDHVYPLAAAWDMGASTWPLSQRVRFANDTVFNLLAVDGPANMNKGDRTPADWLPPARAYHCFYAGKYLTTAAHYRLPITVADRAALLRIAKGCR